MSQVAEETDKGVTQSQRGDEVFGTSKADPSDQAALHGLLAKIRDLGLPLLEMRCIGCD